MNATYIDYLEAAADEALALVDDKEQCHLWGAASCGAPDCHRSAGAVRHRPLSYAPCHLRGEVRPHPPWHHVQRQHADTR